MYQKLKQGVVEGSDGVSAVVLEYDRRFATYGQEFIFYDYNEPLALPEDVAPQSFDIILADPPYLSEDCLTKVAQTVKYLAKGKVLLCTDEPHIAVHFGLCPSPHLKHYTLYSYILINASLQLFDLIPPAPPLSLNRNHHGEACRQTYGSEYMQLPP